MTTTYSNVLRLALPRPGLQTPALPPPHCHAAGSHKHAQDESLRTCRPLAPSLGACCDVLVCEKRITQPMMRVGKLRKPTKKAPRGCTAEWAFCKCSTPLIYARGHPATRYPVRVRCSRPGAHWSVLVAGVRVDVGEKCLGTENYRILKNTPSTTYIQGLKT